MGLLAKIKPAKTRKGKKIIESREPKAIEGPRRAIFVRGASSNQMMNDLLKDLYALKKPDGLLLSKKNEIKPFEDAKPLEFFCKKNDASEFLFTSSSKKRPNNLIIGRTYDYELLDMIELGVENYVPLAKSSHKLTALATKPLLIFTGEQFNSIKEFQRLKSIFTELFGLPQNTSHITLQGIEHVMLFTAVDETVYVRSYKLTLKKSGTRLPRAHLEEMGPNMDLQIRRNKLASDQLYSKALQTAMAKKKLRVKPKNKHKKDKKNQKTDELGTRLGRIHMGRQDYDKLGMKKFKATKQIWKEKRKTAKGKGQPQQGNSSAN